tara:strand:- start:35 stop:322 length:288 start_codon:yes stop_codon:yes gene_type:complete
MRITPRQHIQAAKKPKKANPMARARVARQVPQMRKVFKGVTGVKKGGEMKEYRAGGVIRPKPTFKGKVLKPKPIKDKRGIGIAIRGIGKAFKKGN